MKRLLLLLAACSHVVPPATQPIYTAETVRVSNVDDAQLAVWGLAELGDAVYAFTDNGVTILRGGIAIATGLEPPRAGLGLDGSHTYLAWATTVIPALDGEGRWVVAVRDGALYRVTLAGDFDPIGDRFGIHGEPVDDVQSSGKTIAVQLRNALLVTTDGVHMDRYNVHAELAVARDHLALHKDGHVEVWDLAAHTRTTFAIDGKPMFIDAENQPRLAVVTKTKVWLERDGHLHPQTIPADAQVYVAGPKLWLDSDQKLSLWNEREFALAKPQPPQGFVYKARSGDLWIEPFVTVRNPHDIVTKSSGQLQRFSTTAVNGDPTWQAQVAPVFQHVCSHCHLPGGEAGIDLSTPASWTSEHDEIRRRVLVTRTMPPAGTDLSDADRAALEHWLSTR